jgi:hypothetical protein
MEESMKNWKDNFDMGNESDWPEIPVYDSRQKRLKKSRKKRKNNRDSYENQTPRIRSTWD